MPSVQAIVSQPALLSFYFHQKYKSDNTGPPSRLQMLINQVTTTKLRTCPPSTQM
jgi:hypothetical protein